MGLEEACVLEAGEGDGALQGLAQHVDALGGVRAVRDAVLISVHTTEGVVGQAAKAVHTQR